MATLSCGIAIKDLMQITRPIQMALITKDKNLVLNALNDLSKFKNYSEQDKTLIANHIYVSLNRHPIYSMLFDVKHSLQDIEMFVNGVLNLDPESHEQPSKTDKISDDAPIKHNTMQSIDRMYGTSEAKKLLLQKVTDAKLGMFVFDYDNLTEITTQELVNNRIKKQLELWYSELLLIAKALKIDLGKGVHPYMYNLKGEYTGALEYLNKISQQFQQQRYKPDHLQSLYDSYKKGNKESELILGFLNRLALLNNFDVLIANELGDSIEIRFGLDGIFSSRNDKYLFSLSNSNMTTTFRDDDSDVSGFDETSNFVKMLLSIPYYDEKGNLIEGNVVSPQNIGTFNALLKEAAFRFSKNAKLEPLQTIGNIYDIMRLEGIDPSILNKSFRLLIAEAAVDNPQGYRNLYFALTHFKLNEFNDKTIKLNPQQRHIILSMWNAFFAMNAKGNPSYYAVHDNMQKNRKSKNEHRMEDEHKSYYSYVIQYLHTNETISQLSIKNEGNELVSETLSEKLNNSKSYYIDLMLEGKFNVKTDKTFSQELDGFSVTTNFGEYSTTNFKPEIAITIGDYTIIRKPKESKIELRHNGKLIPVDNSSLDYLLQDIFKLAKFIKQVLNLDVTLRNFLETFKQLNGGTAYKDLLTMVSDVLYTYEVSKLLYKELKDGTIENEDAYTAKASDFYLENTKFDISKSTPQIKYASKGTSALIKMHLATTREVVNNLVYGNIVKDGSGKAMSLVGLSLLATRLEQQFHRNRDLGINASEINKAVNNFTVLQVYEGVEFAREYTGNGVTKKATSFSAAEHFYSLFVLDYMLELQDKGKIKVVPSIISDKSKIMKAKMDLTQSVTFINEEGIQVTKKINELTTKEIQLVSSKELGDYYRALYYDAKSTFDKIGEAIGVKWNLGGKIISLGDDLKNNFYHFNNYIDSLKEPLFIPLQERLKELSIELLDIDEMLSDPSIDESTIEILTQQKKSLLSEQGKVNSEYNKLKQNYIKNLLHNAVLADPSIKLKEVLHYSLRDGSLRGNELLFDLLYRWDCVDDSGYEIVDNSTVAAYELETGYGKAENFFQAKLLEFISSLMNQEAEVSFYDDSFTLLKGKGIDALKSNKDFVLGGSDMIFGKIHYQIITDEGKIEKRTLNLTDQDALLRSSIYKTLKKNILFPLYDSVRANFTPYSPTFNIKSLMDAIDIYNQSKASPSRILNKILKENETLKEVLLGSLDSEQLLAITEAVLKGEEINLTVDPTIQKELNNFKKQVKKFKTLYNSINSYVGASIEIHPDLAKYQAYDYWMSQEYMNVSVGTHINHPSGGKGTLIEKESKAWANQVKRNVSLTAAKHAFTLNLLEGIRSEYNIAVIEDDSEAVATIYGDKDKVKFTDGATFCSIVTNYLENNSLKGDKAGTNKKQFIHDWQDGSGVIIKTAGFAITNDGIRNSKYKALMNRRMLSLDVLDVNGKLMQNIDITKDYNGNTLNYGPIYYELNGNIYKVNKIVHTPAGTLIYRSVLINGSFEAEPTPLLKQLNTNYDIWKEVFGGEYSLSIREGAENASYLEATDFVLSENSAKQLVFAVNNVSDLRVPKDGKVVRWQKDIHQPLKEALIDYVVTEGAIKLGATNVNSKEAYHDENYKLTLMKINTHDAGIQLDAEHHADESVLSLMTLVVNALDARGYSTEEATAVYEALQGLVEEALGDYFSKNSNVVNEFISEVIVKSLKSEGLTKDGDLMGSLMSVINTMYKENKITSQEVLDNFPMDHPQMLNMAVSKISSFLTSEAIRIKFPGSMSVLCPSNSIHKLYKDKQLSHWRGNVSGLGFGNPIQVGEIELGKTYRITIDGVRLEKQKIVTPELYYDLLDVLSLHSSYTIEEDYSEGRDLAAYNVTFTGSDNLIYNIWDLDIIKQMFKISGSDRKAFKKQLQETLESIKQGQVVSVRGNNVTIVDVPKIHPYELICGYMYKTSFGLTEGDDVSDIVNDLNFFTKRALNNFVSKVSSLHYHVELKKVNGDHLYLLSSSDPVPSGLTKLSIEKRQVGKDVYRINSHGNKMYALSDISDEVYVDSNGNQIIRTNNIEYYTNNTKFIHINLSEVASDTVLTELSQIHTIEELLLHIANQEEMSDGFIQLLRQGIKNTNEKINNELFYLKESLYNGSNYEPKLKILKTLLKSGQEIHSSFIKSLDVLAARIPAQCHQSFMAMKIVGFDNSGANNAYVNRMQLYLQGSDYDIDKVSLLGYKFKNGKFIQWSPYMNLTSESLLRASENLPFPTSKETKVSDRLSLWSNLVQSILVDPEGLLYEHNGKLRFRTDTTKALEQLTAVIKEANKYGIPAINSKDSLGKATQLLLDMVNKHNNYLSRKGVDKKSALINFASTYMYKTSASTVNLIQGQTSVDEPTKGVKKPAELQPMHQRAKQFNPGNPVSKIEQMILTLGGKENTGIVASALKVFEALSHSYYTSLANNENTERLFINKEVLGQNILFIANAYSKAHPEHSLEVQEALAKVDNINDAFVLFSALLSLSTDNAKDPTLTKINAGPKMMSLYLAGLALGVSMDNLIQLMTSDLAWKITSLMESNVFVGNLGMFDVSSVLSYIDLGPVRQYKSLPILLKQRIHTGALAFYNATEKTPKQFLSDAEVIRIITKTKFDLESYLSGVSDAKANVIKILKGRIDVDKKALNKENAKSKPNTQTIESLLNNIDNNKSMLELLQSEGPYSQDLQELIELEEGKLVSEDNDTTPSFNQKRKVSIAKKRFLKTLRLYRRIQRMSYNSTITIGENSYKVLDEIKKLLHMAEEMSFIRTMVALNLGLENNISDIIKLLRNFEKILPSQEVDLGKFVNDALYREELIQAYESKKHYINPFLVVANNPHYMGYLKTAYIQSDLLFLNSKVVNVIDAISKNVLIPLVNGSVSEADKHTKKILKFVLTKLNNYYLMSRGGLLIKPENVFDKNGELQPLDATSATPILLGTPEGNATFKHWMEKEVIPSLKVKRWGNALIADMIEMENSKTVDGNGVVSYALNIPLFPKTDEEISTFKKYKKALESLSLEVVPGTNYDVLTLLFYYNLIAYNGESTNGSFSNLFEDIILNKQNSAVNDFISFYSEFGKVGSFLLGKHYTEEELLKFIAPVVHVNNLSSGKLPFYRVYNPKTMENVLVSKIPSTDDMDLDIAEVAQIQNVDSYKLDPFNLALLNAGYQLATAENRFDPMYFTYNFTSIDNIDVPDYVIELARQKGHDVKREDIVIEQLKFVDGTMQTVVDTKQIKDNLTELKTEKEC